VRRDYPSFNIGSILRKFERYNQPMAVRAIRYFGDPVLTTPALEVIEFDKEVRDLVKDLTETMVAAPGAGLAAPQIGVGLRVFTWHVDEEFGHLVNPSLELSEEMQDGEEGCLSFPELRYETPRALKAVAKGFTMYGEPITVEGSEFLARALQHEMDHLNGILFIDRMTEETRREAMKEIRESEWFLENGQPEVRISPHSTRGLAF
jgi:peptide deformylase